MEITNQDFAFYILLNLNDIGFAVQRDFSKIGSNFVVIC
jgi:hypothetical protein